MALKIIRTFVPIVDGACLNEVLNAVDNEVPPTTDEGMFNCLLVAYAVLQVADRNTPAHAEALAFLAICRKAYKHENKAHKIFFKHLAVKVRDICPNAYLIVTEALLPHERRWINLSSDLTETLKGLLAAAVCCGIVFIILLQVL